MSGNERDDPDLTKNLDTDQIWGVGANSKPMGGTGDEAFSSDAAFVETAGNIGRYVDLQKLGQGAYGVVFRAKDDVLKRLVALKLLTQFHNEVQADAWVGEARVLASLDHPSIVPVYDVGKTEVGQPYIVSKLIDGGSLAERAASSTWSIDDSSRVVCQLAHALDYLHHQGIMHRDIKPSNILTTANGDAVLADFGLALPESSYGKGARFVGTPAYMSPEQARHEGHRVDGRSDIYSLGVVFYELLTGTRPFRVKNQEELLDCIRNVEVRPLRQLNAEVPKELERICLKMLSKKVSDRYSTAADLSDDLEDWRSTSIQPIPSKHRTPVAMLDSTPTVVVSPGSTDPAASTRSLDLETIAVIPHGLRPFDAADADFFKYLLPGAKDRDGVPDSISFWTSRILSRNPTDSFRVGVLLGPSGSGKSSLMRAGILPMVSENVSIVYVEAKPDELEGNLLKQIHRAVPRLANTTSLRECLIQARQMGSDQRANKLLLVIDQFEQWLNYHRDTQSTELHDSLRQCDGANVQAILLVRDDFMLGISSFMDQIEELLLQNQNFATVEPFGLVHARKVLAAFGRAYGTLNDPLTTDQSAFLKEATSGLEQIGRLEPVQIALLSEMIKNQPWTPATLKELGGIQGLGVSFLEERLAGASAHPLLRTQLPVVRRILTELLPADDTVIKPPACAQSLMLERLEGIASEDTLRKLLSLLDTEVRLITPTSNTNSTSSSNSGSSTTDPAYQLTHDYLVPTTRKWLTSLDSGTRSGRARQQLREISSAWNAKPTTKRLPSLTEWANIRWFTSPAEWTNAERRMMHSARQRMTRFVALGSVAFVAVSGVCYFAAYDVRSRFLASSLIRTDSSEVVAVLKEIEPIRHWVLPKLTSAALTKADEEPRIEQRKQLHIGLAMLLEHPDQAESVFEKLDTIEDRNLASILSYLSSRTTLDDTKLLEVTQRALRQRQPNALPLAALLCQRQPDHAQWPSLTSDICVLLLQKPNIQIGFWPDMLMPIRKHLLPELLRIGETANRTGSGSLETAASLVHALAKDDPSSIAQAIGWSPIEQLAMLLNSRSQGTALATELRQQLSLSRVSTLPASENFPASELASLLEPHDGQATEESAWVVQLPWNRLNACVDAMKALGYEPSSLRPYYRENKLLAALTWQRGTGDVRDCIVETELSDQELQARFVQLQGEGYTMADFCQYGIPNPSESDKPARWSGVWRKDGESVATPQVLLLNEVGLMRSSIARLNKLAGLVRSRLSVRPNAQGDLVYHSLWTGQGIEEPESVDWTRIEFAAGDLFPGYCQTDLRCENIGLTHDRSRLWTDFYDYEVSSTGSRKPTAREIVSRAIRLSSCGRFEEALASVQRLTETDYSKGTDPAGTRRGAERQVAKALARMGRKTELRNLLDETISKGKYTQEEVSFLYLWLAILEVDEPGIRQRLNALESSAKRTFNSREFYSRALAIIATQNYADGSSELAMQKLIPFISEWMVTDYEAMDFLLDIDFDGIRSKPEWQRLLERCKLTRRFSSCARPRENIQSKAFYAEPVSEHSPSTKQLQKDGFRPVCLDVHSDSQNRLFATSVWHRRKVPVVEAAASARRTAIYALALAKFGETDAVIDGLNDKWGRSVQTAIISLAPKMISSDAIVSILRNANSLPLQCALVSTLGSFPRSDFNDSNYRYVLLRINDWAETAPQVQLKNMSRWCLQTWKEKLPNQPLSQPIAADRNWFSNSLRQQMIVVEPPELSLVGKADERRIWVHIGRRFAISSTEVTGAEFEEFLNDARVKNWIAADRRQRSATLVDPTLPQLGVSWQLAIRYCQWLNERENIPENQWCYKDSLNVEGNDLIPVTAYLKQSGYRLPTQAECEWVSGGGPDELWHFGNDESAIQLFEWTLPHSQGLVQPVARLRPNAFGLFDIGGNLAEWNDDGNKSLRRPNEQYFFDDSGNSESTSLAHRVAHGGRYKMGAASAISSSWVFYAPDYISRTVGFRIARTIQRD